MRYRLFSSAYRGSSSSCLASIRHRSFLFLAYSLVFLGCWRIRTAEGSCSGLGYDLSALSLPNGGTDYEFTQGAFAQVVFKMNVCKNTVSGFTGCQIAGQVELFYAPESACAVIGSTPTSPQFSLINATNPNGGVQYQLTGQTSPACQPQANYLTTVQFPCPPPSEATGITNIANYDQCTFTVTFSSPHNCIPGPSSGLSGGRDGRTMAE